MSKDSVQKEKKEKADAENLVIPSNEDKNEENSKKLLRSKKKKSVHWNPQLTGKQKKNLTRHSLTFFEIGCLF